MTKLLFGLIALFFSPVTVFAGEIMFEGYYRVEASGKPIGYTIQRYEFDAKSKTFDAISFMRVKMGDKNIQESLRAKSNDKFQPISYQYTSQINETVTGIDATFKGQVMTIKRIGGKEIKTETYKIPEGSFLSSFLVFMMLQKKLPLNQAFKYSGIAEEEGASYWGKALLESKEQKGKLVIFRVLNSFKGDEFISKLAAVPDPDGKQTDKYIKGEVLATESPKQSLTTELVASPGLATEGQTVPTKTLMNLFGSVPSGKVNIIATPPPEK